jgi:hypothetical protein
MAAFGLHSGGQMHQRSDRTKHAFGMVNEPHQLAEIGLASEIDYSIEFWMMVAKFADLHENDFAAKMIDHLLVSLGSPPFDGHVVFPSGGNDPERSILPGRFMNL